MALDPVTAGFSALDKGLGIVDQLVDDGDLAAKLKQELMKNQLTFMQTLLTSENVPNYIKFMLALRDVIIPLLRPIGGAVMTGIGLWFHYKGIQIDPTIHAVIDSAFPGWMGARAWDKHRDSKEETKRIEYKALAKQPDAFDYGED